MSRQHFLSFTLIAAALAACAPAPSSDEAVAGLHALFEREWERDMADNPLQATYRGDRRYDDRWPDLSPEAT